MKSLKSKYDEYFSKFDNEVVLSEIPTVRNFFDYLEMTPAKFQEIKHDEQSMDLIYKGLMEIKSALYRLLIDTVGREERVEFDYEIIRVVKRELVEAFFYKPEYLDYDG